MDAKHAFDLTLAQAHIERLANDHSVGVGSHASGGRAFRRSRRVNIRPVKSPVTYAIALHELGHVLGHQSGRRIDKEVQAWEWAKAHALVWTKRMQETKQTALASYVRWAESKQARTNRVFINAGHAIYKHANRSPK